MSAKGEDREDDNRKRSSMAMDAKMRQTEVWRIEKGIRIKVGRE